MRQASICLELDLMPELLLQEFRRLCAALVLDHLRAITVAHEEGCVPVDLLRLLRELLRFIAHHQVAAEAEDARELVLSCDAREDRHGATLRKATQDDAVGGDASGHLVGDELGEDVARAEDAHFVVLLVEVVEGCLR